MIKLNKLKRIKIDKTPIEIEFINGEICLIDRGDLLLFSSYKWFLKYDTPTHIYLVRNPEIDEPNKIITFHRTIMELSSGLEVDHINRNTLDNRKDNLRIVTHQINMWNRKKLLTASSKYRGVSISNERGLWCSYIKYKGKTKNLGRFKNQIEAAIAYNNFIIKNNLDIEMNDVNI